MSSTPSLTPQTFRVIESLFDSPGSSGADICRSTSLASGTVYPILARLVAAGWAESNWEQVDATEVGRPRKKFYRLTSIGAAEAAKQAAANAQLYGGLAT